MGEQDRGIPPSIANALEESPIFDSFCEWGDAIIKRATTDPAFNREELLAMRFLPEQKAAIDTAREQNEGLLRRFCGIVLEAHEKEVIPVLVETTQTLGRTDMSNVPVSLVQMAAFDPQKARDILSMSTSLLGTIEDAVKSGYDLGKAMRMIFSNGNQLQQ